MRTKSQYQASSRKSLRGLRLVETIHSPVALVAAFAAAMLLLPSAVRAGGVVTNCTEANLRAAMAGGGGVSFACDGKITLASTITNATDIVVDGTGHQVTISGGNSVRVFWVGANATLTLVNLTVANGAVYGGPDLGGAGILNSAGTVNATHCTFSDNTVSNGIPGMAGGGAILNGSGLLQLRACEFDRNQACGIVVSGYGGTGGGGGAIYNQGGTVLLDLCTFTGNGASGAPGTWQPGLSLGGSGAGGAIFNNGTLEVRRSAFGSNWASGAAAGPGGMPGAGAGDGNGGAICNLGTLSLDSSLLEGNSATGGAGGTGANGQAWMDIATDGGAGGTGGLGAGGGLFNRGTATVVNSTFAGNSGGGGPGGTGGTGGTGQLIGGNGGPGGTGGSGFGAIYDPSGLLHLTNCTFASNSGSPGPGGAGGMGGGHLSPAGWDGGPGPAGTTGGAAGGIKSSGGLLVNTLLAANSVNCSGWVTDGGHNLSSDGNCPFTALGSVNNIDPKLGPVANNGGPTLTMALLPGSPAIDAGDTSLAPTTDQRGFPRPAGLAADLGAFEYGSVMPAIAVSRAGANGLNILGLGNVGQYCRLLSSPDLRSWVPMATNQIGSDGTVLFYDTCSPGAACRFYRLVMP